MGVGGGCRRGTCRPDLADKGGKPGLLSKGQESGSLLGLRDREEVGELLCKGALQPGGLAS